MVGVGMSPYSQVGEKRLHFDIEAKLLMGEKLTWDDLAEFCWWSKSGPLWPLPPELETRLHT